MNGLLALSHFVNVELIPFSEAKAFTLERSSPPDGQSGQILLL